MCPSANGCPAVRGRPPSDPVRARRAVLPISFDNRGLNWITKYADTIFGGGPGRADVCVYPDRLHITMGIFRLDVPRALIRNLRSSTEKLHGTTGTHSTPKGRLVVNGSDRGLVEFELGPPLQSGRGFAAIIPRPPTGECSASAGWTAVAGGDRGRHGGHLVSKVLASLTGPLEGVLWTFYAALRAAVTYGRVGGQVFRHGIPEKTLGSLQASVPHCVRSWL